MAIREQVITDRAAMDAIAPAWERLADAHGTPVDAPVWHRCALAHAHPPGDRLHVIALWSGEGLVGLAPLVRTAAAARDTFELMGTRVLYEPARVLAATEEAAARLAALLTALPRPLVLTRVTANDAFAHHFVAASRRRGVMLEPRASGSPFIDLAHGWEAYYGGLPSRLRNIIRRGERQLSRMAPVSVEILEPGVDRLDALLERAFGIEMRSWKGRAGSAVLQRPDLRGFFFAYAARLAERGQLRVAFLRAGDRDVAMQVANVSAGAFWQLKIGYDEAFARQLTGLQLQLAVIRWSFEQGLRRYEFLGTAQPWIAEWTRDVRPYRTFLFYPRNLRGLKALLADGWAGVRRKLFVTSSTTRSAGRAETRDPADSSDKMARLSDD